MTAVGAATLVRGWGRQMTLSRNGVVLESFKGRLAEIKPEEDQLDQSVYQFNKIIIACVADFRNGTVPVRLDKVTVTTAQGTVTYTVLRARTAGADVDELWKLEVRGGEL